MRRMRKRGRRGEEAEEEELKTEAQLLYKKLGFQGIFHVPDQKIGGKIRVACGLDFEASQASCGP